MDWTLNGNTARNEPGQTHVESSRPSNVLPTGNPGDKESGGACSCGASRGDSLATSRRRRLLIVAIGCSLLFGGFCYWVSALVVPGPPEAGDEARQAAVQGRSSDPVGRGPRAPRTDNLAAKIESLCSTCHLLPTPDVEPADLWPRKIEQMYGYMRGARPVPENRMPPIEEVIDYWASRAPEYLALPPEALAAPPSPLRFRRRMVKLDAIPSPPAVSCVRIVRLTDKGPTELLISDLRHGVVALWTPSRPTEPARIIARIPNPSHTTVVDLDKDGRPDILVANMGIFGPRDTTEGSVVWLRNRGNGEFEPFVLIAGLGRVNDVQPPTSTGTGNST